MRNLIIALIFTLSCPAIASSAPKKLLRAMNLIETANKLNTVQMAASKRSELLRAKLILDSMKIEELSEFQKGLYDQSQVRIQELETSDIQTAGSCRYFETIKSQELAKAFERKQAGDSIAYWKSIRFLLTMAKEKSSCAASRVWIKELNSLKVQS